MGRLVKYKNYKGMKIKEVVYNNEVDKIYQPIIEVGKDFVRVVSQNDRKYWVRLSDKVVMTMNPQKKDWAVIKTFPDGWLVVDLIKDA